MNKLFSILFVMTIVCYGTNNPVNQVVEEVPLSQVTTINPTDLALIKKGSCLIAINATNATDEEKEAAYQVIETALTQFGGDIPKSININVGIANLELVDPTAYDLSTENQDTDHVIAVKDISVLEVVIDIECEQATAEEKSSFFGAISAILSGLCNQLQSVASGITGSVSFDSPDLVQNDQSKGLFNGVIGNVVTQVASVTQDLPIELPTVPSVPSLPGVPSVPGVPSLPGVDLPVAVPLAPVLDSVVNEVTSQLPVLNNVL